MIIRVLADRQGWVVKCEKGGLRRVLMNLIGNSLKFTSVSCLTIGFSLGLADTSDWLHTNHPAGTTQAAWFKQDLSRDGRD